MAFISLQKIFNKISNEFILALSKSQATAINVIVENKNLDDIETFSNLFNLPDDVRAVFCLDSCLFNLAYYYAGVKQIPLIFLATDLLPENLFLSEVVLKNGNKIDKYKLDVKKIVLLDKDLLSNQQDLPSKLYAFNISKLVALYDYRINSAFYNLLVDTNSYQLARQSVLECFNVFASGKDKILDSLYFSHLKLLIANGYTLGALFKVSSINTIAKLIKDKKTQPFEREYYSFFKMVTLYAKYLNSSELFLGQFVDYIDRAKTLAKITGVDATYFISCLSAQMKAFKKNAQKSKAILDKLSAEISSVEKLLPTVKSTYLALKGRDIFSSIDHTKFIKAIKACGDTSNYVNGVSVLRENGILSLID